MLIIGNIRSFIFSLKSINWRMKKIQLFKRIRDFLCKNNIYHSYETIKTQSGLRVIKQHCKCKNCKIEKVFYHDI